jgi:hypothetical protein
LFSAGVDPSARDANGLTLLHIACQNNQRKTAKLVLKRTDFSTNPPRLQLINKQTNLGQTALHYAFAYGYQTLGEYLLSLGADDRIVNVHGMTCYDGLDPDEPARETLNTPEMLELARRKKMERRAETLRPGTHVGNGFDQDGYDREDTGAPSSARGPWSDSAYSGYSGKSSARSASSVAHRPLADFARRLHRHARRSIRQRAWCRHMGPAAATGSAPWRTASASAVAAGRATRVADGTTISTRISPPTRVPPNRVAAVWVPRNVQWNAFAKSIPDECVRLAGWCGVRAGYLRVPARVRSRDGRFLRARQRGCRAAARRGDGGYGRLRWRGAAPARSRYQKELATSVAHHARRTG